MNKIGIFSGTFDPVHAGHIAFALEAMESAGLDKVYFLPESMPRRKSGVTHYAHRLAMLNLALKPYDKLGILELPDKQFSVSKTLPRLKAKLPDSELFMLIGSDMLMMLSSSEATEQWPGFSSFLRSVTLMVVIRDEHELEEATQRLNKLQPAGIILKTNWQNVSSSDIRSSLMQGSDHDWLLASLKKYVNSNWLYASVDANNS